MGHNRNGSGSSTSGPGDSSNGFPSLSRHVDYYLIGGDLYILSGHVLFRIHRYFFERESPFFQRRLQVPASPGAVRQGSDESTAIVLEEASSDEFAKFLWVFYNPKYSLYRTSIPDWIIILRLSHIWDFPEVKNLVIRELEKFPPSALSDVERIAIYHQYEVDRAVLIPRYAALCSRETPLTLEESKRLGMETALMIMHGREYARAGLSASGERSPTRAEVPDGEMESLIRMVFEIQTTTSEDEQADGSMAGQVNGTANGTAEAGTKTPTGGLVTPPTAPVPKGKAAEKGKKTDKPAGKQTDKPADPQPQPTPRQTTAQSKINIKTGAKDKDNKDKDNKDKDNKEKGNKDPKKVPVVPQTPQTPTAPIPWPRPQATTTPSTPLSVWGPPPKTKEGAAEAEGRKSKGEDKLGLGETLLVDVGLDDEVVKGEGTEKDDEKGSKAGGPPNDDETTETEV